MKIEKFSLNKIQNYSAPKTEKKNSNVEEDKQKPINFNGLDALACQKAPLVFKGFSKIDNEEVPSVEKIGHYGGAAMSYNRAMDMGFHPDAKKILEKIQNDGSLERLDDYYKKAPETKTDLEYCRGVQFSPQKDDYMSEEQKNSLLAYFNKLDNMNIGDTVCEGRYLYATEGRFADFIKEEYATATKSRKSRDCLIKIRVPKGSKILRYERNDDKKSKIAIFPKNAKYKLIDKKIKQDRKGKHFEIVYEYLK